MRELIKNSRDSMLFKLLGPEKNYLNIYKVGISMKFKVDSKFIQLYPSGTSGRFGEGRKRGRKGGRKCPHHIFINLL